MICPMKYGVNWSKDYSKPGYIAFSISQYAEHSESAAFNERESEPTHSVSFNIFCLL